MKNGKRELLIGAVGLAKGSVRNGGKAMVDVCNELESEVERTRFLESAPFEVISLVVRYGTEWGTPELGRINKRHSELEVAVEVPMAEVRMLDEIGLTNVFRKAALNSLLAVGGKYNLNVKKWDEILSSFP